MDSSSSVIAIVDDDIRLLESVQELLESAGFRVLRFSSGVEICESGVLEDIDCLVTDIGMPGMDGFELARIARTKRPDLPVILITGRHELIEARKAGSSDQCPIFRKPFDGKTLLAAIEEALQKAR